MRSRRMYCYLMWKNRIFIACRDLLASMLQNGSSLEI